ncbi:hypothetical protein GCM10022403_091370 [Streptomyces coacervatus]|uniref:Uncharacterized protein n=1 Tax=Streptomyces coacervatus TaxID=647381 RepID=A0ABP7JJI1_9ACTN|nr:hypothetical protein [Streptomyces coacervatus]MDF2272567.1 hypothetical protein [Streptomyces coacervatus]
MGARLALLTVGTHSAKAPASYDLQVPAEHRLFAQVMGGRLLVGAHELHPGQTGWSDSVTGRRWQR